MQKLYIALICVFLSACGKSEDIFYTVTNPKGEIVSEGNVIESFSLKWSETVYLIELNDKMYRCADNRLYLENNRVEGWRCAITTTIHNNVVELNR